MEHRLAEPRLSKKAKMITKILIKTTKMKLKEKKKVTMGKLSTTLKTMTTTTKKRVTKALLSATLFGRPAILPN